MKIASLLFFLAVSLLQAAPPESPPKAAAPKAAPQRPVCPWAHVDPKKGAPRDIAALPETVNGVYSFMAAYAPHWVKAPHDKLAGTGSFVKQNGQYSITYYSTRPEENDFRLGFEDGTKRVRFEMHGPIDSGNLARHSEPHAHFEVLKNGQWVQILRPGVKATGEHGSGWLPNEGAPPGFFMRAP